MYQVAMARATPRADRFAKVGADKLRVGYVSADFYRHPVGWLGAGPISSHDRAAFHITVYANQTAADDLTSRVKSSVDAWVPILGLDDDTVAAKIAADGIDLLVDLSGHTAGNRLGVFARRPARVQAAWLGYFATTGLPTMDYVLMDEHHLVPGAEQLFVEKVITLPGCRFCYCCARLCRRSCAAAVAGKGLYDVRKLQQRGENQWRRARALGAGARGGPRQQPHPEMAKLRRSHSAGAHSFRVRKARNRSAKNQVCRGFPAWRYALAIFGSRYCARSISIHRRGDLLRGAMDGSPGCNPTGNAACVEANTQHSSDHRPAGIFSSDALGLRRNRRKLGARQGPPREDSREFEVGDVQFPALRCKRFCPSPRGNIPRIGRARLMNCELAYRLASFVGSLN